MPHNYYFKLNISGSIIQVVDISKDDEELFYLPSGIEGDLAVDSKHNVHIVCLLRSPELGKKGVFIRSVYYTKISREGQVIVKKPLNSRCKV